jgi:5S rRNA maturation endonuclease (ribonuclease M5)
MRPTREEFEEQLNLLKKKDLLIIVEGKKDLAALARLGFTNRYILTLEGPLYRNVEQIASIAKRVALLPDLDPEGRKLYSSLKRDLSQFGVQIDDTFREFLFRKTKLRQIEGMDSYIEKLGNTD